jgi:hypothetical protein
MRARQVVWWFGLVGAAGLFANAALTMAGHPLPQPLHSVVRYGCLALVVLGFGLSRVRRG